MKGFIIKILIAAIPCILFLGWVEWKLRSMPNDYTFKKEYLDQYSGEIEQLILGSSLSWRGIMPRYIGPHAYNAAFSGQSLKYDDFLLTRYKDQLSALKEVIVTIYYPTFEFEKNELLSNLEKYYSVYFDYGPPTVLFNIYNGAQITNQFRKYGKDPQSFIKSNERGYRVKVAPLVGTLEDNGVKMAGLHSADFPKMRKKNLHHLEHIRDLCSELGVELYLIIHPTNEYYLDNLDPDQVERMRELCNSVQGDGVHIIDWFEHPNFSAADFFDGIHLNEQGAEKFSQLIQSELNGTSN